MDLKSLLGLRPKADTSDALRASLAETQAAIESSRARIAELEMKSGTILLDGSPEDAARHEEAIEAERRQVRRLELMAAELPARIAAAVTREQADALEAERVAAEALAAQGTKLIPEIERHSRELLRLVAEHDALTKRVIATNKRLAEAGRREDRVALPTRRAWPHTVSNGHINAYQLLADITTVPGPRGACVSLGKLDSELTLAKTPPAPVVDAA